MSAGDIRGKSGRDRKDKYGRIQCRMARARLTEREKKNGAALYKMTEFLPRNLNLLRIYPEKRIIYNTK